MSGTTGTTWVTATTATKHGGDTTPTVLAKERSPGALSFASSQHRLVDLGHEHPVDAEARQVVCPLLERSTEA